MLIAMLAALPSLACCVLAIVVLGRVEDHDKHTQRELDTLERLRTRLNDERARRRIARCWLFGLKP
jgi:hypothetical protein